MNTQLVESLVKIIQALSTEDRSLLEERLFFDTSEFSTRELMQLTQRSQAFDFLQDEPDLYTLEDGESAG
jgi:hypothetical protein